MYLLDTNVLSDLRRRDRTNPGVAKWADAVEPSELFVSAISILELELGILLLERRDKSSGKVVRTWTEKKVLATFHTRILPVDLKVALQCTRLHVPDPRSERDALIAATAIAHDLTLVTRNSSDFSKMPVKQLNPWN